MENIKDLKSNNLIAFIIVLIVIFISEDTFLFGTNENFNFLLGKYLVYFVLLIYLLFTTKLDVFFKFSVANLFLYLFFFGILLSMILNFDFSGGSIYQLWLILLGFLISQKFTSELIAIIFNKIMFFLCWISIVVYIIAVFFPFLLEVFPTSTNVANVEFINLYICTVFKESLEIRSTSIFREPGVFMIYIIVAILFHFFIIEKKKSLNLIVYVIALTLTFSTAAYIIVGILGLIFMIQQNKNATILNKMSIFLLFLSIILIVFLNGEIYTKVFSKLESSSGNYGSTIARTASIFVNLNIFFDNFISGVGVLRHPETYEIYSTELLGIAMPPSTNTNTITTILAIYGIIVGFIFCLLLVILSNRISKSILISPLIFLVFLLLFSNESIMYSIFTFVILFWGIKFEPKTIDNNKQLISDV